MHRTWTALLALILLPVASQAKPGLKTRPDPGSHAERLHALLRHPSFREVHHKEGSRYQRVKATRDELAGIELGFKVGPSRARAMAVELAPLISKLRAGFRKKFGADLRGRVRLYAGNYENAWAHDDHSVTYMTNSYRLAKSVARAWTAKGADVDQRIKNLWKVAESASQKKYTVYFGSINRESFVAARDGAASNYLAHELGHVVHTLDVRKPKRPPKITEAQRLIKLIREYMPLYKGKVVDLHKLARNGDELHQQQHEADADRAALDVIVAKKMDVNAFLAMELVTAMQQGLRTRTRSDDVHAASFTRFEDERLRLNRKGIKTAFDGLSYRDIEKAREKMGTF